MTTAPMTGGGSLPESEPMAAQGFSWERWSPLGGVIFAVLMVVGFLVDINTPDNAKPNEWTTFYTDRGNRIQQIVGAYLLVLSAFAFLWFITGIMQRMRELNRGEQSFRTSLAASSGLVTVVMLLIFATMTAAVSASISIGGSVAPAADFGIQFEQLAFGLLLIPGLLSAAVFIALTSLTAMETGMYARWFVWVGYVCAVILLFGPVFFPIVALPIWALIAGILMLSRQPATAMKSA